MHKNMQSEIQMQRMKIFILCICILTIISTRGPRLSPSAKYHYYNLIIFWLGIQPKTGYKTYVFKVSGVVTGVFR